jgi:hypothetical protein
MNKRLDTAMLRKGRPPANATPAATSAGQVELFVGGYLLPDNTIALRQPGNDWLFTNGKQIWSSAKPEMKRPCHPELAATLKSILIKLHKELAADIASDDNDLRTLEQDQRNLLSDLASYNSIYQNGGYDANYEVDYGTNSIPVYQAISRTQQDISQNQLDYGETVTDRTKTQRDLESVTSALDWFRK